MELKGLDYFNIQIMYINNKKNQNFEERARIFN